jgi:capsid protein
MVSPMVRMSQSRKNKRLFAQHLSRNHNFISRHFIGLFILVVIGLVVSVHVYLKNQEVCLIAILRNGTLVKVWYCISPRSL